MITLNQQNLTGSQITNQELFLDYKETYLLLQRALLRNDMDKEMKKAGKIYEETKAKILKIEPSRPDTFDSLGRANE